ncbi:MAG TPA: MDR family MFS transporter [Acidimicrobiales bacterium]|nr:MDR family MFS transporter [Acidimicrobiales bacterium]
MRGRAPDGAEAGRLAGEPVSGRDGVPGSQLSHRQILVVLTGVMAGMLLAALDQSIVGTALPRIVSDLGGLNRLSWVVTAYLLTSTATTPLWGKVSDLYGRRLIFQVAIATFLAGSALSGLSHDMTELILFRGLQGVGGGGLMSIALAIIGDVIPPRQRGRYQGYFGAVFGLSSVVGPLLGGLFTDTIGWRWIFYINLPIGAAALVITSVALRLPMARHQHRIDYLGAATIIASVTCLLLYLNWAGGHYGWLSPGAFWLVGLAALLAGAFVAVERRAVEPIIPMRLFANRIFSTGNAFSFLSGMAMFGAAIFLPVYLQAVKGMSPTRSGLALVPVVAGVAGMSVVSGRIISHTGRYRLFPILGASVLLAGQLLLAQLHIDTPYWQVAVFGFLAGAGLGMTMQTVVLAVQNSIDMRDMGTATSATTFSRMTGAAIGTAVFGAVLASRFSHYLAASFGRVPSRGPHLDTNDVQAIRALPEPVRHVVLSAFAHAIDDLFLIGVPFVVIALVTAFLLPEIPLRTGGEGPPLAALAGEAGEPTAADGHHENGRQGSAAPGADRGGEPVSRR